MCVMQIKLPGSILLYLFEKGVLHVLHANNKMGQSSYQPTYMWGDALISPTVSEWHRCGSVSITDIIVFSVYITL